MKKQLATIKIICGIFVTAATLEVKAEIPIDFNDLDHFSIDCSRKQEQVSFIQSLTSSKVERQNARIEVYFTPWRWITDYKGQQRLNLIGNGSYDFVLRNLLWQLNHNC